MSREGTAAFAIAYIYKMTDGATTLNVNQIRVWAHRGHVRRTGTDPSGFAIYNLDDIIRRVVAQPHKSL